MEDNENEVSLTDSAVMDDSGVHSTPVSTKESNISCLLYTSRCV